MKRFISIFIILSFIASSVMTPQQGYAQDQFNLPAPGAMVNLSPAYVPLLIKGLKVHPENPLLFDFVLDTGRSGIRVNSPEFKTESKRLIKYFLASLTIKEDDLWVNLSPYEKDRMIPRELGQTELGRGMLAQDYILKQLTASLIYPERQLGKEFWNRVYAKAQKMYATSEVPVNTFNKVWIVADKAKVLEHNNAAYIIGAHLKVMLEEDYLALQKHNSLPPVGRVREGGDSYHSIASQIVKQIIIPELEKEVNQGRNFAPLRQMFYSMILASWYKQALKTAFLNQVYANKNKIGSLSSPNTSGNPQYIYQQYLKAYKKGVFNYIKEDIDTVSKQPIARKYFSGGEVFPVLRKIDRAQTATPQEMAGMISGDLAMVDVDMVTKPAATPEFAGSIIKAIEYDLSNFQIEQIDGMKGLHLKSFKIRIAQNRRDLKFGDNVLVRLVSFMKENYPGSDFQQDKKQPGNIPYLKWKSDNPETDRMMIKKAMEWFMKERVSLADQAKVNVLKPAAPKADKIIPAQDSDFYVSKGLEMLLDPQKFTKLALDSKHYARQPQGWDENEPSFTASEYNSNRVIKKGLAQRSSISHDTGELRFLVDAGILKQKGSKPVWYNLSDWVKQLTVEERAALVQLTSLQIKLRLRKPTPEQVQEALEDVRSFKKIHLIYPYTRDLMKDRYDGSESDNFLLYVRSVYVGLLGLKKENIKLDDFRYVDRLEKNSLKRMRIIAILQKVKLIVPIQKGEWQLNKKDGESVQILLRLDNAMSAEKIKINKEAMPGGIDLSARNMGLDIAKEGDGVEMKFDPAMIAGFQREDFSGITPVIISITPIASLFPLF